MTRLVGVRAVCDGCSAAAAVVFCVSHRNVLCSSCDQSIHHTLPHHQRVDLSSAVTALPFCEHCDDAPATTYCESEGTTFCDKCDRDVHAAHSVNHFCTPISRTLRSRGVEFRGRPRSRHSTPVDPSPPPENSPSPSPDPQPTVRQKTSPPNSTPSLPPQAHHRVLTAPRKRSSKPMHKRRHRRDSHRASHSTFNFRSNDHVDQSNNASPHSTRPDDYTSILNETLSVTQNDPFSFRDSLLMAPEATFSDSQHGDIYTSNASASLHDDDDLRHIMPYTNLDLSGDAPTALEDTNGSGKSASGSLSGASSHRKSPDYDLIPHALQPGDVNRKAVNVAAAAAAAATAAGELYLLNSVSSGSGSSRERSTTPLDDLSFVPDPAGVAKAATAAAKSAVAAADMQHMAQGSCEMKTSHGTVAPIGEPFSQNLKGVRTNGMRRRPSERTIGMPSGQASRENGRFATAVSIKREADETDRKIDNASGVIPMGRMGKEAVLIRPTVSQTTTREGNTEFGVPMSDAVTDDVLPREGDGLADLEISRDNFGFDAMDLLQFDQNEPSTLDFNMDSDDG